MMIIIFIVIIVVIFLTFLCGWNLVLSFCFAEAAADNRPRWRRPASQINIFLVVNIAFIIMASEFEEEKNLVRDRGQSCGLQVALAWEAQGRLEPDSEVLVSVVLPLLDSSSRSPASRSP